MTFGIKEAAQKLPEGSNVWMLTSVRGMTGVSAKVTMAQELQCLRKKGTSGSEDDHSDGNTERFSLRHSVQMWVT